MSKPMTIKPKKTAANNPTVSTYTARCSAVERYSIHDHYNHYILIFIFTANFYSYYQLSLIIIIQFSPSCSYKSFRLPWIGSNTLFFGIGRILGLL